MMAAAGPLPKNGREQRAENARFGLGDDSQLGREILVESDRDIEKAQGQEQEQV